jgi:hypothetical protein
MCIGVHNHEPKLQTTSPSLSSSFHCLSRFYSSCRSFFSILIHIAIAAIVHSIQVSSPSYIHAGKCGVPGHTPERLRHEYLPHATVKDLVGL